MTCRLESRAEPDDDVVDVTSSSALASLQKGKNVSLIIIIIYPPPPHHNYVVEGEANYQDDEIILITCLMLFCALRGTNPEVNISKNNITI